MTNQIDRKMEEALCLLDDCYQEIGHDLAASFEEEGYDVDVIVDFSYGKGGRFQEIWDGFTDEQKRSVKKAFRF